MAGFRWRRVGIQSYEVFVKQEMDGKFDKPYILFSPKLLPSAHAWGLRLRAGVSETVVFIIAW
jgi:hypothetical protein